LNDTKNGEPVCCTPPLALHEGSEPRLFGDYQEAAMHPRNPASFTSVKDVKHTFFHAKLEVGLFISFTKKSMSKKSGTFDGRGPVHFQRAEF
jgi:hypothetical protein